MFGPTVNNTILQRAKETTDEICGYIQNGEVHFGENKAENPAENFMMVDYPEDVQAIFHSHPGGPFYPSKMDMQQQCAMDIPWGIACFDAHFSEVFWFGGGAPMAPLVGRGFRHGVTDCYEAVRDFYSVVHSIELMPVPREWEWWGTGSLYEDNFAKAGFRQIGMEELLPGDAFLATIRANTPNHAGVYLGNGLIFHHTSSRTGHDPFKLSTIEPAARWMPYLHKAVRYDHAEIDRTVGQGIWPRV